MNCVLDCRAGGRRADGPGPAHPPARPQGAGGLHIPPGLHPLLSAVFTAWLQVVSVYGGPGSQTVSDRWAVGWEAYLATTRNWIVAR